MRYLQKVWKWLFGIIVVLIFCLPVVFLLAGNICVAFAETTD